MDTIKEKKNQCLKEYSPNILHYDSAIITLRFDGGGAESQAFVVEGMGVALEIFDDMELTRINKK